jgi:hypothetical protein
MPPKGSKRAVAPKKAAMTINASAVVAFDANGFLVGSKEANWAFLKAKGNWFTFLDDADVKEAERHGMFFNTVPPFLKLC